MSNARTRLCAGAAVAGLIAAGSAAAQPYPARQVRVIVPFAIGGGSDSTARILGQQLSERMKQTFVIENRTGAGGAIGTEFAARAAPDGYTLLLGSASEIVQLPAVSSKLRFDPLKDFVAIARVADVPLLLVTHPALPAKTVKELIALARKRPGEINYGSAGNGSTSHLTMALFSSLAGTQMVHVPYKGGTVQANSDLVAGALQAGASPMPSALPFVKGGRLRAIAVTTAARSPLLPDVPTVAESGVPGFEVTLWTGMFAPAGTPREVVAQLEREIGAALSATEPRDALARLGSVVNFSGSAPFGAFVQVEFERWSKLSREANIRLDQ